MAAVRPTPSDGPPPDGEGEAARLLAERTAVVAARVGARARAARLAQGRTQEEVAASMLVARNSLQTVELADRSNPRLSTLVGLAHTLGVTVEHLVAEDPTT